MNSLLTEDYKTYEFSTFETKLMKEAIKKVDPQLKGNYHKGAVFECFLLLTFEHVIEELGLTDKIQVLSNPYDRKYKSRKGRGIDLMITYKKPNGHRVPIIYVEAKDWTPRYMSPKVFLKEIHQRFWNTIVGQKLVITRGISYSIKTLNKLTNYRYKIITHNYQQKIKQIIKNKIKKYNTPITNTDNKNNVTTTNNVPLHMTNRHLTPYTLEKKQYMTQTCVNNGIIWEGG